MFLANYSDGLTNLPLYDLVEYSRKSGKIACFISVKPPHSYHVVTLEENNLVSSIQHVQRTDIWINGGFFVFRKEIFDYMRPGEDLVVEPFQRLIMENQLIGYKYDQLWCMDTFKEHQELTDMYNQGNAPWEVWKSLPEYCHSEL